MIIFNIFESMCADFETITGQSTIIDPPDRCFGLSRPARDVADLANMARAMEVPQ